MKNVKIVFTDLDYTLTTSEGVIDIKYKRIFEKLADIGVPVVINTGRSISYTIPICKQFNASNYIIATNGAEIYNHLNDKFVYKSVISKEDIDRLDNIIKKNGLLYTAFAGKNKYTNKNDEKHKLYYCEELSKIDDDIAQVVLQSYDVNLMINAKKDLIGIDSIKIVSKSSKVEDGKLLYYDIVNKEVSKGNALVILCNHLNIDSKKAMAIGDSFNDLDMLNKAGYKVTVSNAIDELKQIANIIAPSNTSNGVLTVLNELYNQKTN